MRRLWKWNKVCVNGMLLAVVLSMAAAVAVFAYSMLQRPGRIQVDCRGYEIDAEVMRSWEKRERDGVLGLTDMAGWRVENQDVVRAAGTGRSMNTQVIGVCGSMDMVYPVGVLSGSCGLAVEDGYCVLSSDLAFDLFGGTDVAGEEVAFSGTLLTVAGVIDKTDHYLLYPVTEGGMEQLALEFEHGLYMEEKVEQLLGGG